MSIESILIITSILTGFLIHLFYFGRGLGRLEAEVKGLSTSFSRWQEKNFMTREEYEARHAELTTRLDDIEGRRRRP